MRRHEHKAPINPTPDGHGEEQPAAAAVWGSAAAPPVPKTPEAPAAAASAAAAAADPPKARRRVHIHLDEDDEGTTTVVTYKPQAAAAAAGEPLTAEQYARRNKEYPVNSIVEIEYSVPGDGMEHIGYGEVVRMAPIPMATRSGQPTHRTMRIRWLYDYEALVSEENVTAEAFEKLNFQDGDLAFSNHEQDVNVYNVVRTCNDMRETIEFYYDGHNLMLERHRGTSVPSARLYDASDDDEDGDEEMEVLELSDDTDVDEIVIHRSRPHAAAAAAQAEAEADDESLPRHLFIVKEFLFSNKIWSDTKYGADWWFMLNSLLSMGHSSTNTRARSSLEETFFDSPAENREPLPGKVTWDAIDPERAKCAACGIVRMLTWRWVETGWDVGKTCKQRIDVLRLACDFLFNKRAEAMASKPHLPIRWLKRVTDKLNELRSDCMLAIAGESSI